MRTIALFRCIARRIRSAWRTWRRVALDFQVQECLDAVERPDLNLERMAFWVDKYKEACRKRLEYNMKIHRKEATT
ncbi:MAG: hypothetical protein UW07_C0004G0012 [Candidatus Nomurabacteria bacterium GW2011_GWF2_43_8]|uniref:Uncharacterized protein n=3 Tax=Candidatus Nomuraibacteriota TaxID=1752729 RepID=A0A0G1FSG3_9BACT|nr:MAG: hypothetical protein UV76_C0007G0017 [Candidatus Nomurabacteria bacterium GW2011_GWA2_43_15]KKT19123.1 MAG: hypothetical protein UW02_C0015G0027 [Candidatus Nomurabacteria bacterium GW2011_GWB1_43_7]KKT25013.1 MAG: hypothetical protein UW07_C0004G0012 [Candidatus Nomurabacteria bacterium GW2011_GWF2_43_8]